MKPNIVFILADDMGYGDFSALNGGLSSTPTLDHLMAEGICLSQHYTASPVCNPSRACLLTGRYPHRTGSIDTLEWRGLERLALRETTLADVLKAGGYATGLIGKWHLGSFDMRYHPMNRGFDESVCFRGGMHDYYDWRIEYNEHKVRADGRYLTDVWTEEAVNYIDRHQKEPFFLHVTYNAPHTPLQAPDDEIAPFRETGKFNKAVSSLYGMLHRMDTGIGTNRNPQCGDVKGRTGNSWRLPRYPREIRDVLNTRGRWIAARSVGVELRFVCGGPEFAITLTNPGEGTDVTVRRGSFWYTKLRLEAGQTRRFLVTRPPNFGDVQPAILSAGGWHPQVWRIQFDNVEVLLDEIDPLGSPLRPPTMEEKPALRWLAYGSSITNADLEGYPFVAAQYLRVDPAGQVTVRQAAFDEILRCIQKEANDPLLHLIEGTELLTEFSLLAADMIHPTHEGHAQMGTNLATFLRPLISGNCRDK